MASFGRGAAAISSIVWALACGADESRDGECAPGAEACSCKEDGTCDAELSCFSGLCVDPSGLGGTPGRGGTDSSDSGAGGSGPAGGAGSSGGGAAGNAAASAGGDSPGGAATGGAPDGGGGTTGGGAGGASSGGAAGSAAGSGGGGSGGQVGSPWSDAVSLVDDLGRLAIGNRVHVVGHLGSDLVHRSSQDDGATWSSPKVIAPAAQNFPAMYGGLFAVGDTVHLITGVDGDMASAPRQMDFRKSTDNGDSWSAPVRITGTGEETYRARVVASGNYVHVVGAGDPQPNGRVLYFRSVDGGTTWDSGRELATNLGEYGGGQTVAADGAVVHVAYTTAQDGVGAGPTSYIRSTDNGDTWSQPIVIGESSAESSRQARVQVVAADGHVFACWQREGAFTGAPIPADRLGYNTSADGGLTWGTARVLPEDTGINRNHQQVWMTPGGSVHLLWRHGNTGDTGTDPAGAVRSPDYGETWQLREIAVDTAPVGPNHPFSLVADTTAVHVLTGPGGAMQYAYRPLP